MTHKDPIQFGGISRPVYFLTEEFGDYFCLFCTFDECNGIFLDTIEVDYFQGLNLRNEHDLNAFSRLLESGETLGKAEISTINEHAEEVEFELEYEIRTPIYGHYKGEPVFSFPAFELEIPVRVSGFVASCLDRLRDNWGGLMLGGNLLGQSEPLAAALN